MWCARIEVFVCSIWIRIFKAILSRKCIQEKELLVHLQNDSYFVSKVGSESKCTLDRYKYIFTCSFRLLFARQSVLLDFCADAESYWKEGTTSTLGKLCLDWGCPGFKSIHLQEDINSIYRDWKISGRARMSDEICHLKASFKLAAHVKFSTSVGLKKIPPINST